MIHYCNECSASYKEKRHLTQHKESLCPFLTQILVIKCPHCDSTFKFIKSFGDHMSSKQGIGERFECDPCGEKFNYHISPTIVTF